MSYKHLHAIIAIMAGLMLAGCHSDLDLNNIDPKAEVKGSVAFPVGTVNATLGDFIGNDQIDRLIVDSLGVFHFHDTLVIPTKEFHSIDVRDYILENESDLAFNIADEISASTIYGDGVTNHVLNFDMELGMTGINDDVTEERIDSIWVTEAKFTSVFNVKDFDLNWSEIKSIKLKLGDQFSMHNGGATVVDIPISGSNFGKNVPINVNDFTLDLMDPSHKLGKTVDKIKFEIEFTICPDNGHNIAVKSSSQFTYDLVVNVLDYEAIWGFFEAGKDMHDARSLRMDSLWDGWKGMKELKVNFAEPTIQVFLTHHIAAPMMMHLDSIAALTEDGKIRKAHWLIDGKDRDYYEFPLENKLSPIIAESALDDSVTNRKDFSYKAEQGHLDELFEVRPDFLNYGYHLTVDKNATQQQHRMTKNKLNITGKGVVDIPMKFKKGSELSYSLLLDSVNLSNITLDSLLNNANILDTVRASELKMFLTIENSIPFNLKARVVFLDKDSVEMKLNLVENNDSNVIDLKAPKMEVTAFSAPYGVVTEPSSVTYIVNVKKNDFDHFAEIKKIRLDATIDGNPEPCILDNKCKLSLKVGLTANIDAILDLGKEKENK